MHLHAHAHSDMHVDRLDTAVKVKCQPQGRSLARDEEKKRERGERRADCIVLLAAWYCSHLMGVAKCGP